MEILGFLIILAVSFFIAGFCENRHGDRIKVFAKAFVLEFLFVSFVGYLFWQSQLGYFEGKDKESADLLVVIGFASFMSIIVGGKAVFPDVN